MVWGHLGLRFGLPAKNCAGWKVPDPKDMILEVHLFSHIYRMIFSRIAVWAAGLRNHTRE